jgi:serine/threonine protein kinase/tetratricopeptide (TPR) repeat protein
LQIDESVREVSQIKNHQSPINNDSTIKDQPFKNPHERIGSKTVALKSGRYRIVRKLGEGGMGIVYAAHDDRLDRPVAIKRLRPNAANGQERERLWREARTAASVNHPNICQLYEIDSDEDGLFLAMELLDGEPLSVRLTRGSLPPNDASQIALSVLGALGALHQRGIVHRDLKPSNIFLARHGVKLLDFGLARSLPGALDSPGNDLTLPGVVMGTPRYMAPEQIEAGVADARSDLFVVGAVLYEMVAGRPAFDGNSVLAVARAITSEEPAALGGSSGIVALDRVIHRALRKRPDERYQAAAAFAQDLRAALLAIDSVSLAPVRPITRLVVMPFRVLRPDPAIDFLAFSLADAVSSALAGLPSLVIRSTAAASRFSSEAPDLAAVATALEVDVVLLGSMLTSGGRVRVTAQLVQVPSGTLMRAITLQSAIDEIFQLQDALAKQIVDSLALSLSAREQNRLNRDTPADAEAYELYLRANRLQLDVSQWHAALELYQRCVDLDPQFAPAWARLGRCYRLIGKFGDPGGAEANLERGRLAIKRALDINADLSFAHQLYAYVEVEAGDARDATVRLLERVRQAPSEPELFAGLVHTCRYCGLLDASVAAFERAERLDPAVATSAAQTFLLIGDWERAFAVDRSEPSIAKPTALYHLGRIDEALEILRGVADRDLHPQLRVAIDIMIGAFESRWEDVIGHIRALSGSGFADPEGFFHWAGALALAGDREGALEMLERTVEAGFYPASALATYPNLDPLRSMSDFHHIVRRAEERQRDAREAFRAADGPRLLGLPRV